MTWSRNRFCKQSVTELQHFNIGFVTASDSFYLTFLFFKVSFKKNCHCRIWLWNYIKIISVIEVILRLASSKTNTKSDTLPSIYIVTAVNYLNFFQCIFVKTTSQKSYKWNNYCYLIWTLDKVEAEIGPLLGIDSTFPL